MCRVSEVNAIKEFTMAEKDITDKRFVFRLLTCVQEQKLTEGELHIRYVRRFPPSFITRSFIGHVSLESIVEALHSLHREGFVARELTRYIDRPLRNDTPVYCLSDKGRAALLKRKK